MIYISKKRKEDFKEERAILASKFPHTFTKTGVVDKPMPIIVELVKRQKPVAVYMAGRTDMSVGTRKVASADHKIACRGKFVDSQGLTREWHYAKTAPVIEGNELKFANESIRLSSVQALDPVTDFEKIVMLYFYSPNFQNNYVAEKSGKGQNALFKFLKQGEKSDNLIAQKTFEAKYLKMLVLEEDRISDEMFKEITTLMNFTSSGITSDDRVALFDSVLRNETIRGRFDKIADMVINNAKSTKVSLGVAELVKAAKKAKVLSIEGTNWVLKNANGVMVADVAEAVGSNQGEKDTNLVEYLKVSSTDKEKIEELLSKVE